MKTNQTEITPFYEVTSYGLPIRLEIASRILAGMFAQGKAMHEVKVMALTALEYADALIEAHNQSTEAGE